MTSCLTMVESHKRILKESDWRGTKTYQHRSVNLLLGAIAWHYCLSLIPASGNQCPIFCQGLAHRKPKTMNAIHTFILKEMRATPTSRHTADAQFPLSGGNVLDEAWREYSPTCRWSPAKTTATVKGQILKISSLEFSNFWHQQGLDIPYNANLSRRTSRRSWKSRSAYLESGANYCSSRFPYSNATQECLLCISQNQVLLKIMYSKSKLNTHYMFLAYLWGWETHLIKKIGTCRYFLRSYSRFYTWVYISKGKKGWRVEYFKS